MEKERLTVPERFPNATRFPRGTRNGRSAPHASAQPATKGSFRTGHMGNTFSGLAGGVEVLKKVFERSAFASSTLRRDSLLAYLAVLDKREG